MLKSIPLIVLFVAANANYVYQVIVTLGRNKWTKQEGKLEATFLKQNNYGETVLLSSSDEELAPKTSKVTTHPIV